MKLFFQERVQLNDLAEGRGLFASAILTPDDKLMVTYQLAPFDTLTDNKNLFYQIFNRDLTLVSGQRVAVNVTTQTGFSGDLGDHKIVRIGNYLYMVKLMKGLMQAGVLRFNMDWNGGTSPTLISDADDKKLDMGWCTDGTHLYAQFFYSPSGSSKTDWRAHIYKIDPNNFNVLLEKKILPESGTFVTGTSCSTNGPWTSNRIQSFSTNTDYNAPRVGIHTFASQTSDLTLISGTTKTLVNTTLDVYFPTGVVYNSQWKAWVLGYTMERNAGDFPNIEPGLSYIAIFDEDFNHISTHELNGGADAFWVMMTTEENDLYVVYDTGATQATSAAKLEYFKFKWSLKISASSRIAHISSLLGVFLCMFWAAKWVKNAE